MPKLNSQKEFQEYCLRRLGDGMIKINITPYQIVDRVEEAIQVWNERHMDGSVETAIKHIVTQEDIDRGFLLLPDDILRVESVLPINNSGQSSGMFNIEYQLHLRDVFDMRNAGSISNYVMTKQYLGFLNDMLNGRKLVEFSRRKNRLEIHMNWQRDVKAGDTIVMVVDIAINPENDPESYNDSWLKKYATALLERQWGKNISKFGGIEMLGGVTYNGADIVASAQVEIESLEQELDDRYQEPPMFFVG